MDVEPVVGFKLVFVLMHFTSNVKYCLFKFLIQFICKLFVHLNLAFL